MASLVMVGLIPAHAGSTAFHSGFSASMRAHPRSRGEHFSADLFLIFLRGSSPLTRGALNRDMAMAVPARLIPAHAGSTLR